MLVNHFLSDELDSIDLDDISLGDCTLNTNGETYTGQQAAAKSLSYMLQNSDSGITDTNLYKALAVAANDGIIDSDETNWNIGITKAEFMEMLCNTLIQDDSLEVIPEDIAEDATEDDVTEDDVVEAAYETDGAVDDETETTDQQYKVKKYDKEKTLYATTNVNLREGPSTAFDVSGSLSYAQKIKVVGEVTKIDGKKLDKKWYELSTGEFVRSDYTSSTKPETKTSTSNSSSSSSNSTSNSSSSNSSSSNKNNSSSNGSSSSSDSSSSKKSDSSSSKKSDSSSSSSSDDEWKSRYEGREDEIDSKLDELEATGAGDAFIY
jgi:hypothetical protein